MSIRTLPPRLPLPRPLVPATEWDSRLRVSADSSHLVRWDGRPFFWLGDTAWLIALKLTTEEVSAYLDSRVTLGFSVIQVMALHGVDAADVHGHPALPENKDELLTLDALSGSYWETMDRVIDLAAVRGIYVALVPIWGTVVQEGQLSHDQALAFTRLLARRYCGRPNIVWLNGGDVRGSDHRDTWSAMGSVLREVAPHHLITFHPFGRTRSSLWFHESPWLDFHMFQSGHRNYDQRTPETEVIDEDVWYGEDNWRYVLADRSLPHPKPTLDGEPSYEDIPHGLHDPTRPRWTAADCRRYAYWALLAGAFGHTYGHNSIMQFFRRGDRVSHFGAQQEWKECLDAPGAQSMAVVKSVMELWGAAPLTPFELPSAQNYERYRQQRAAFSPIGLVVYAYSGGIIEVPSHSNQTARWIDPRTGAISEAQGSGGRFMAPGGEEPGNDWILVASLD